MVVRPVWRLRWVCVPLFAACGASAPPPAPTHIAVAVPELPEGRLDRVRGDAPELAALAVRLRDLAEIEARSGNPEVARELAALSTTTLLNASEIVARLEAGHHQRDAVVAELQQARAAPPAPAECPEPTVRPRRRRPPPEPTNEETDPAPATPPVRAQLATLATRLSELPADMRGHVEVESIQSSLIEADRALSEGLEDRAIELAREAERQLDTLAEGDAAAP